ncbi:MULTISPECIES: peptide antibiotic transporter SbmA [unclassified Vibrio]|uniref:Peptide antibiotic transporter SbmA n=1 Tax=Vibrio sp. HB236076 TaxID=3232307 RepID=A0AB39HF24_9VIBR|nr:peptide antibiotic transporter SbmA [Vibrio sp. HB161653]MDP5254245.1 peptide antibiotic transporter SbmA [Vibrio sp. HB161653]
MFDSFFPKPKWFFLSFSLWSILCVVSWYCGINDLGQQLSLAHWVNIDFPAPLLPDASEPMKAEFESLSTQAINAWQYQYMLFCYAAFCLFWIKVGGQKWAKWSVLGSALIVFITWFLVEVNVMLNEWYGDFYNLIQTALSKPDSITIEQFYHELSSVAVILMVAITVSVLNSFFVSHFVFRWRTAMTEYYTKMWHKVRHIEGASQRIQEDTMRFASIVEGLGVSFLNSVMTLIAFLPILWGLSGYVKEVPIFGEVPQALVFVAIIWSIFGTTLLALSGIKLPGLEFNNQKVEAAYRKELVYGEDFADRAQPPTLKDLFSNVRQSYFKLYLHYVYFNIVRYGYLQVGAFIPLIVLAPSIVAGAFTLGVMQRILNAFNQVENSFQYLVNSWTTIVELMSIYKRLKAFEKQIDHTPEGASELAYDND